MVDGTPGASHTEQTTFILRYLTNDSEIFTVHERFLAFADCFEKSGLEITNLRLKTLENMEYPLLTVEAKAMIMLPTCQGDIMVLSNM